MGPKGYFTSGEVGFFLFFNTEFFVDLVASVVFSVKILFFYLNYLHLVVKQFCTCILGVKLLHTSLEYFSCAKQSAKYQTFYIIRKKKRENNPPQSQCNNGRE